MPKPLHFSAWRGLQPAACAMRLSLLDQALAFGNGAVRDAEVAEMLGSLDRQRLTGLLEALAQGDAKGLMSQVRQLDELAPDYEDVLAGLATLLQQIAVIQLAGADAAESDEDRATARAPVPGRWLPKRCS